MEEADGEEVGAVGEDAGGKICRTFALDIGDVIGRPLL
jgi:hypothetical protein